MITGPHKQQSTSLQEHGISLGTQNNKTLQLQIVLSVNQWNRERSREICSILLPNK
uniref:Uncharacterized protein n=1 Tax=Arundo donax TaxID=35708 RepID=A0A0A9HJ91_ARUDO